MASIPVNAKHYKEETMDTISIKFDGETTQRLAKIAAQTNKSEIFHIYKAVEDYLEDLEDIAIAKRELEKIRNGEAKVISNEEALKIIYGSQK